MGMIFIRINSPISSIIVWVTITAVAIVTISSGSDKAKGNTTNEFLVPLLKANVLLVSAFNLNIFNKFHYNNLTTAAKQAEDAWGAAAAPAVALGADSKYTT